MLRQCLVANRPDLLWVIDSEELVRIDEQLGNELREAVVDELIRVGLKNDDEPNALGKKFEELIDQIGRLFY
ncbi:hypothetical protein IC801_07485 [Geobacillus sp. 44B]|nr:hypothetical protein BSK33_18140 [Geobacillus sp. 44B]QNU39033.1 hypothetical protein IC801_07485 [Geobacillus sp. 44B]